MADSVETETTTTTTTSLPVRSSSPSPSIPATPAISSCPSPDRTFSTISSLSFSSATSADARSSVSISTRRRGYIRPQGAEFAESARNRESVMSLGSIAHLQYYFARTGLLDGKGGHAREYKKKAKPENVPRLLLTPNAQYFTDADAHSQDIGDRGQTDLTESPTEDLLELTGEDDGFVDETDEVMLPPTVSTYSIKTHHIPPPPDLTALRKDLLDALGRAEQGLRNLENGHHTVQPAAPTRPSRPSLSPDDITIPDTDDDASRHSSSSGSSTPQGWHEIQGMRILDVVTLAIRAARIYYTAHERPDRLAAIKSERRIRQELFNVLEVLKRWAGRNFAGGLRDEENAAITNWMADVRAMMSAETRLEEMEAKERDGWTWARGDWTGREREREAAFLASLMATAGDAPLPPWTPLGTDDRDGLQQQLLLPTPLLARLRDGRDLVRMHNQAVRKSKRLFGEIKAFHQDTAKPYRCAENIRYWLKAAEIRWEVKLDVGVMGVVYGSSDEAWRRFDAALLVWCRTVREELIRDWQLQAT